MEVVGAFNEERRLLGDVDYWTRAAVSGLRFCRLDEVLALMMLHPKALSVRFPGQLQEELAVIRNSVDKGTYRPRSRTITRIGESLRWRTRQFAFRKEARREHPQRWQHFIGLLRELGLEVGGSGVLLLLLPGRMLRNRPRLHRMLDSPEEFQRRFFSSLQAQKRHDGSVPPVASD
jgi:hypothetical protein